MVPLAGNDWMINENQSLSAQGQVPGTVHTILFAANKIPDPYLGYDDVSLRYLVYSPWTFRKKFTLADDFLALTQFTLHFDQLDTVANITLNTCFLGQTNNMFLAYTFNVMKSCLQSNNELRIDFDSPVAYALKQSQAYGDTVQPNCPSSIQNGECHVNFIRKEPCSFSWDWVRIQ
jgi:beta-mannosidase